MFRDKTLFDAHFVTQYHRHVNAELWHVFSSIMPTYNSGVKCNVWSRAQGKEDEQYAAFTFSNDGICDNPRPRQAWLRVTFTDGNWAYVASSYATWGDSNIAAGTIVSATDLPSSTN